MATRRDYVATAEVLRSTPMPAPLRQRLAERMASAYGQTSTAFNPAQFVHEATRPARTGETETVDLDPVPSGTHAVRFSD